MQMEEFNQLHSQKLQTERVNQLSKSLAAWRVPERSDVTIICGEKKFYVHKIVLASSCPYFEAIFRDISGPEISANNMQHEILDAILDFIYLGAVTKIKTEKLLKEVLQASHVMQIPELVQYCCLGLENMMSTKNAVQCWNMGIMCANENLKAKAMNFVLLNFKEIIQTMEFLQLPNDQIRNFLGLAQSKLVWMDDMLTGLVQWLLYNVENRAQFSRNLFACVDHRLVSKERICSLSQNAYISNCSAEIIYQLNELMLRIDHQGRDLHSNVPNVTLSETSQNRVKRRITFLSEFVRDQSRAYELPNIGRQTFATCFQQFDLQTMTWLPPVMQCAIQNISYPSVCQWHNCLCILGGGSTEYRKCYSLYDLSKNHVRFVRIGSRPNLQNATICYFKDNIYVIGGRDQFTGEEALSTVLYAKPESEVWKEAKSLHKPRCAPLVLTSTDYMYVIDNVHDSQPTQIECNYSPDKDFTWQIIMLPQHFQHGHYFIFLNSLHVHCIVSDNCVVLKYNHGQQQWEKTKYSFPYPSKGKSMFQVLGSLESFVYITTNNDDLSIPTALWEPESGKFTNLQTPTGKPFLTMVKNKSASVWTIGI